MSSYSVYLWDHEIQDWFQHVAGVSKWGLRRVLRLVYSRGWGRPSILVQADTPDMAEATEK